jgi:Rho GTPase-activating protein 1
MPVEESPKTLSADKKKKYSASSFFGLLKSTGKGERESVNRERFFGVPLSELKNLVDGGLPRPIKECLDFLSEKGYSTEGIFRLSASQKDLEMARSAVERGLPLSFNFELSSHYGQEHIAASLIKSFLRELPEPILKNAEFDETKEEENVNLDKLPAVNFYIIRELFRVLKKIDAEKERSKMDASNLAVLIGPNLLWTEDPATKERVSPIVASKMAFTMILHYDDIFDH